MDIASHLLVMVLGVPVGYLVGVWLGRRARREAKRVADGAISLHQEALERTTKAGAELQHALDQAALESARADRYFACIQNIERERGEWQVIYHEAVAGAQNAQELLMAEIARLVTELRKATGKGEVSPKIKAIAEHFRQEFSAPDAARPAAVKPAVVLTEEPPKTPLA